MKTKLKILAKDKGFTSKFLYDGEYQYAPEKEKLRWLFWLTEIQNWLREKNYIFVSVDSPGLNSHRVYIKRLNSTKTGEVTGEYIEALKIGIEIALNLLPNKNK